ncbi:CPBP family intramembrane metalloprotease [bacterium]|nr:CPBP family intramembrane metalloprotease [bacterium]
MKVFTTLIIALALLVVVDLPARGIIAALSSVFTSAAWWIKPLIRQSFEVLTALILMIVINRGVDFNKYGFRLSGNLNIWKSVLYSPILFVISLVIGGVFAGVITAIAGPTPTYDFGDMTLFETIIKVWLLASIGEEIVFRGLILTYLSSRIYTSFSLFRIRITHATVLAAIFFSLAHFMLLTKGAGAAQMAFIAAMTFILGLGAGYFREKTGSLVPAIIMHVLFNVFGHIMGTIAGA